LIKVLVAEDMHMVRGALVALLDLEPDIDVVAQVASGDEIMPSVRAADPHVAIIDIDLPGIDGLTAAAKLAASDHPCRTLILTSLGRPGAVRRAMEAKVNGFMLKDAPPTKLANAVRQIAAGRRVIDNDLALTAWDAAECPLTAREAEILRQASLGGDVTEIAAKLFLSVGTVRNYLTAAVTKLNARNRVDAVRIAKESGWL